MSHLIDIFGVWRLRPELDTRLDIPGILPFLQDRFTNVQLAQTTSLVFPDRPGMQRDNKGLDENIHTDFLKSGGSPAWQVRCWCAGLNKFSLTFRN